MSNQRPGKKEKKLDRNGDMQVYKFFKTAAKLLNEEKKEDEAFYMEQMVDWLQSGKPLPTNEKDIIRALGLWQLIVVFYWKIKGYVVSNQVWNRCWAGSQRQKI